MTRTRLAALTGTKYDVMRRYYYGEGIERADLTILAKFCFVLKCRLDDIMVYIPPQ